MKIRAATPDDAEAVLEIYAPYVLETAVSFESAPPSVAEMRQRIAATTRTHPWLVGEIDGKVAGYAYASAFRAREAYRFTAESTIYVHKDFQKRGVGQGLYEELLRRLRDRGFATVIGGIALPNDASVGLHERLGFVPAGRLAAVGFKFDQWWDVGFWQLRLK